MIDPRAPRSSLLSPASGSSARPPQPFSPTLAALRRFSRNRSAVLGLGLLSLFLLVALFAPWLAPHPPNALYAGKSYLPPAWVQRPGDPAHSGDQSFVLGTDTIGRDVLSRVVYGARTSMAVGFIPLVPIVAIGLAVGLTAGYFGGTVDNLLMRLTDIVYAFPALLFFILLLTALRDTPLGELLGGFVVLFVGFALVSWVTVARLVRGQVLAVRESEYVQAARALGASDLRVLIAHILPNSLAPVLVAIAFIVPSSILAEAVLSYLGIGIRPNADLNAAFPTSWGALLVEGSVAIQAQPALVLAPLVCLLLVLLGCTLLADGVRDALDPTIYP